MIEWLEIEGILIETVWVNVFLKSEVTEVGVWFAKIIYYVGEKGESES